jgi:NAD(P)-dependent dehydrogenase (short-subunit alcohol dehydrogenase family)
MQKNALVIGAKRGIGKELFQTLSGVYNTYGTVRILGTLEKNKNIIQLNLEDEDSLLSGVNNLKKTGLKFDLVLFIAAKTKFSESFDSTRFGGPISISEFEKYLKINCFSQIKFFEYMLYQSLLNENCRTVFFSSQAGSIELRGKLKHNKKGGDLLYRISKAALNAGVKNIAYDLQDSNHIVVSLHPGFVQTDSGGPDADLTVPFAASAIFKLIEDLELKHSGQFINFDGKIIPW